VATDTVKRVRVAEKRIRRDSVGHFSVPRRLKYVRVCVFFFSLSPVLSLFYRWNFLLLLLLPFCVFSTRKRQALSRNVHSENELFFTTLDFLPEKRNASSSLFLYRDHRELFLTSLSRGEGFLRCKYPVFGVTKETRVQEGRVFREKRVSERFFFEGGKPLFLKEERRDFAQI
jgi:hypothetical protein